MYTVLHFFESGHNFVRDCGFVGGLLTLAYGKELALIAAEEFELEPILCCLVVDVRP